MLPSRRRFARASSSFVPSAPSGASANRRAVPPGFEQFLPPGATTPQQPEIERGTGSGFVVSADGYILTNHHVIENADLIRVQLLNGTIHEAKLVGSDVNTDLAVLKIDAKDLVPAALGVSTESRIGEWVLAIGNPLGENLTFTVTSGIISAKGRGLPGLATNRDGQNYAIQDFIQTDATINRGNSGGPLVNVRGQVIGINSAIASDNGFNMGYGFAIPIDLAKNVMNQLIATGKVERAVLGVQVNEATAIDAEDVGLEEVRGVKISDVLGGKFSCRTRRTQAGRRDRGSRRPAGAIRGAAPADRRLQAARRGGEGRGGPLWRCTQDLRCAPGGRRRGQPGGGSMRPRTRSRRPIPTGPAGPAASAIAALGLTVAPITPAATPSSGFRHRWWVSSSGRSRWAARPRAKCSPVTSIQSVGGATIRTEADLRKALESVGRGNIALVTFYTTEPANGARRFAGRCGYGWVATSRLAPRNVSGPGAQCAPGPLAFWPPIQRGGATGMLLAVATESQ